MAKTAEEIEEEKALAEIAGGFTDKQEEPQPTVVAAEPVAVEPAAPTEAPKSIVAEPAAAPPAKPAKPKYAQITVDELRDLRAAAEKTATYEGQFNKVFGTIGNMQQLINRVQSQTPSGAAVEITDEDFPEELRQDYPGLTGNFRSALENIFKRINLRGTGEQPATAATIDPAKMQEAVQAAIVENQKQELEELHPGWQKIVGAHTDTDNAYRKWLATQPADYQKRIHDTYSASVTARSIEKFKADTAPPVAQMPTSRPVLRNRFRGAVQPRGTGAAPPPTHTRPEDEIASGFARR